MIENSLILVSKFVILYAERNKDMKKPWGKILYGICVFFFSFAIFCCSICNLTRNSAQANVAVQNDSISASLKIHYSCCPPPSNSPNGEKCQDKNFLLALQPEKLNDLGKSIAFQISKIILHFNAAVSNSSNLAFVKDLSHVPPPLLQKSVPIYLSNRVLRL